MAKKSQSGMWLPKNLNPLSMRRCMGLHIQKTLAQHYLDNLSLALYWYQTSIIAHLVKDQYLEGRNACVILASPVYIYEPLEYTLDFVHFYLQSECSGCQSSKQGWSICSAKLFEDMQVPHNECVCLPISRGNVLFIYTFTWLNLMSCSEYQTYVIPMYKTHDILKK